MEDTGDIANAMNRDYVERKIKELEKHEDLTTVTLTLTRNIIQLQARITTLEQKVETA
jgi:hypothetical protein